MRVAHGDPGLANDVEIVAKSFDVVGLEIQRVVGHQETGIGTSLDFDRAADVQESAATRADVVVGVVGFEMLILEVVLDMAASQSFGGLVVVFDVIGAQTLAGVADVDIIVCDEEIAFAALGSIRGKLGDTAFGGGRMDLLRTGEGRAMKNKGEAERR
jgi:hypothetical protein